MEVYSKPEVKEKKSLANRPEVKKKISDSLKGRPPWNTGLTKETDPRLIPSERSTKNKKEAQNRPEVKENRKGKEFSGKNIPMIPLKK